MTPTKQLEVRSAALGPVEFREAAEGLGTLHGYAAMFNRLSQNLGGWVEQVDPGAFTKSLADATPVMCRYNHDNNLLLGTTEAETLRLVVDGTGLLYDVDVPDTSTGRDTRELARRGDVRYSSFAFYTLADEWSLTDQGFPLRTLLSVQLVDVAPVNNPAYRDTTVAARSLQERTGLDLDAIAKLGVDELRDRLTHTPSDHDVDGPGDKGQRATHPLLVLRTRLHDLDAQR